MPNLAQAFCFPRIARVEQCHQVVQNTMAAQHNAGEFNGGVGGAAGGTAANNVPNMVAEPGALRPDGQTIGGGQQVPIPTGGTPGSGRG